MPLFAWCTAEYLVESIFSASSTGTVVRIMSELGVAAVAVAPCDSMKSVTARMWSDRGATIACTSSLLRCFLQ